MLWTFRDRILDLKKDRRFKYILLFKNHGEPAGASLEHAHSQLIALPIVPIYVLEEIEGAKQYYIYKERCVFCDIIQQETETEITRGGGERRLRHARSLRAAVPVRDLDSAQAPRVSVRELFVAACSRTWPRPSRRSHKADRVLDNPAYNLVIHSSPVQDATNDHYHWHIEFMPKLTRTAGFEWGTGFYINPTPPEEAARFLREAGVEEPSPATVG